MANKVSSPIYQATINDNNGVAITNGKTAIVMADGTNVIALATESA